MGAVLNHQRWRRVMWIPAFSMFLSGFSLVPQEAALGAVDQAAATGAFALAARPSSVALANVAIVPPVVPVENATLIGTIDGGAVDPVLPDPAGIAYLEHANELLISDSEVDEEPLVFSGFNLVQMGTNGSVSSSGLSPGFPIEPTGLSYDPVTRHIFITNDMSERLYEVGAGPDGVFGSADDQVSSFDLAAFGASDAEDVAFDTRSRDLFIADGINLEVFRISSGTNGVFDGAAPDGDDVVSSFDVSGIGIEDLEGLGYREVSDTLLLVEAGLDESIYEFTKDGFLLRRIDLNAINIVGVAETPSDVVVAPASDGSGRDHLYLVDRKDDNGDPGDGLPPPIDGKIYELATPFADLPPYVDAGEDGSVVVSSTIRLNGIAVDDGQPVLGAMTATWTAISGPGDVSFVDPSSAVTDATFTAVGTYVLQLAASDSVTESTDTVQVVVSPDPPLNKAPIVDVGTAATYRLSERPILRGSATDDGLPNPPGALVYRWERVSGPGSVTFSDVDSAVTAVAFGTIGTYVLRLIANDGELAGFDDVAITVLPNPPGSLECTDEDFAGAAFVDIDGLSTETRNAIDCLVLFGITKGTSPTTFAPFDPVPRWQMALFLTRQAEVQGVVLPEAEDQGFTDIAGYPLDVQKAINQLARLGITVGTEPGRFSPAEPVSRWQMALFVSRLLARVGVPLPSGVDQGYADIDALPPGTQLAINQITQLNVAQGIGGGMFDPYPSVRRWQMALFLVRSLDVGGLG